MVDVKMYTREGCRGGRDNFKWGDIKEQDFKDREQYLGASMKVGLMAKFGKYYVHDWYAQKRDTATSIDEERQAVQQYEEELMQEALGLKPKKLLIARKELSPEELAQVLMKETEKRTDQKGREQMGPQKGTMVDDANGQEVEASILFTDARIDGLGFAAHRNAKLEKYKSDVLGTESKLEGIKCETMKSEVKSEPMTEEEKFRLGPGGSKSSSSASGAKKEEVKAEVKAEGAAVMKPDADAVLKAEDDIKNEPADPSGSKRHREDEDPEERKRRKAEKKAKKDKKQKKAEKKARKKVKKATKKEKKAVKIAAKLVQERLATRGKGGSSDSSSSSS